jgi:hypothetical protein
MARRRRVVFGWLARIFGLAVAIGPFGTLAASATTDPIVGDWNVTDEPALS